MRRSGQTIATLIADGDGFQTRPVPALTLDCDGISGDNHHGPVRKAGGREPWHRRGTLIRNTRAVSLVSRDDLAAIARALDIEAVDPAWIGANLVLDGFPHFSFLPAGTRLFFAGGAVLLVTEINRPCRIAGAAIAGHIPARPDLALDFAKKAQGLRGVVAVVERAGRIADQDSVEAHIPAQWTYPG